MIDQAYWDGTCELQLGGNSKSEQPDLFIKRADEHTTFSKNLVGELLSASHAAHATAIYHRGKLIVSFDGTNARVQYKLGAYDQHSQSYPADRIHYEDKPSH
jgi:hypothetical protein